MSITRLYVQCPICTESSHINQWATPCYHTPTYQRFVDKGEQLGDHSNVICPKCLTSSMYGELN